MAWTIKRTVDLQKGDLHQNGKQVGILSFPGDEDAHIWEVTVLDGGEPAALSGTVTAYFMRSFDGNSVVATGSFSGNVVSVAIPAGAYAYQGLVTAILRLTVANESTVTIDAIAFSVGENHTGTIVDPGEVIDVDDILAQYDTMVEATADCVAATATAEGVTSIIAAAYSTSKTYAVGEYVTRSGSLYRCTTAITEPEAWTSGHWSKTTVGAESRGSVMSGGSISTNAALLALTGDGSLGNLPLNKAFYISSGVHPSSSQTAIPDEPIFRFFGTVITIAQSATAKSAALQMAMLGGSTMGDELYYRRGTSTGWQPWIQVARSAFLAPVYSSSSTYAIGDYVTYNGVLYCCKSEIDAAESWTSGHWEAVTVGDDLGVAKAATEMLDDAKMDRFGTWTKETAPESTGRWNFSTGAADTSKSTEHYATYTIQSGDTVIGYQGYYWDDSFRACGFYDNGMHLLYTPTFAAGTAITETRMLGIPRGAKYFIVNRGSQAATGGRGVYSFTPGTVADHAEIDALSADTVEPNASQFLAYSDYTGLKYAMRYKDVCFGDGNIYAGAVYSSDHPYHLTRLQCASNGVLISGAVIPTRYRIDVDIGGTIVSLDNVQDSDNNRMQISQMTYCDGCIYIACRAGSGAPSDLTANNSYLVVIDSEDLGASDGSVTACACIPYHERVSTVRAYPGDGLLITGDRGGGFTVYDISTPGTPVSRGTFTDSNMMEFQHGSLYEDGNGDLCIAWGCYTDGIGAYTISSSWQATNLFRWNGLSAYGSVLNVFAVDVSYPYLYASVSPNNTTRKGGSRAMGVIVLDISNPSSVVNHGFFPIPPNRCGHWATSPSWSSTITLNGSADPAPNFLRAYGSKLYVSNEDAGVAVYDISTPTNPVFEGNINTGVWARYFWLEPPVLFQAGTYDHRKGIPARVVGMTMVLGGDD